MFSGWRVVTRGWPWSRCGVGFILNFAIDKLFVRSVAVRLIAGEASAMVKLVASAVIAAVCAVALTAPAHADGGYIVMAGSDSTHTFETTVGGGLASLGRVETYAVSHCAAHRGATDCRVLAEGEGGCVALSDDGPKLLGAWGATRDDAIAAVVAKVGLAGATADNAYCVGDPELVPPPGSSLWTTQ